MKDRHWINLVTNVRHGQTVLVLGSEIPDASGASEGVLGALRNQLKSELEEEGHRITGEALAEVAQQYEDTPRFGGSMLRSSAEKFYTSGEAPRSDVHTALATLPFNLILTSSHDDALLRALRERGKQPVSQRYHMRAEPRDNPEFSLPVSPDAPLVFHLFGHVRDPGSLVLSENDLLDFIIAVASKNPPLPNSFVHALQRPGQAFLFVGFGIKQWYLRVLLKVLVRVLKLNPQNSAIIAEPLAALPPMDREQTVFFYQRGTAIEIADTDVHSFVAELNRRVEAAGGYVGRTSVGPRARVFISYASEDVLLATQVFDALRSADFEPWFDKDALQGGDRWDPRIEESLAASDFVLVLHTPALSRKTDSYVNKEVALAMDRGLRVRGRFLIQLTTDDLRPEDVVPELAKYHSMTLRRDNLGEDLSKVVSLLRREYQLRNR